MSQLNHEAEVTYAVVDDFAGIKFWPQYKFWLGAQESFTVTDKYKGKRDYDWGRPCIYLNNKNPMEDPDVDYDWMEANCIVVKVTESIFHASNMYPHC